MYTGVLWALALVCLDTAVLWGKAFPDPVPPSPQEVARIAEAVPVTVHARVEWHTP